MLTGNILGISAIDLGSDEYGYKLFLETEEGMCYFEEVLDLELVTEINEINKGIHIKNHDLDQIVLSVQELVEGYALGSMGPSGGLIFYIDIEDHFDWTFLEAAPSGLDVTSVWPSDFATTVYSQSMGDGLSNTLDIIAALGEDVESAAKHCDNLAIDDIDDWFLPTKDELRKMYENIYLEGFGDFTEDEYWSSSEVSNIYFDDVKAWTQDFGDGNMYHGTKSNLYYVRCARAF